MKDKRRRPEKPGESGEKKVKSIVKAKLARREKVEWREELADYPVHPPLRAEEIFE